MIRVIRGESFGALKFPAPCMTHVAMAFIPFIPVQLSNLDQCNVRRFLVRFNAAFGAAMGTDDATSEP